MSTETLSVADLVTRYPTSSVEEHGADVHLVPIGDIHESSLNHRRFWRQIGELADSIEDHGVRHPALGRPSRSQPGKIELAYGARRRRAVAEIGERRLRRGEDVGDLVLPIRVREMTDEEVVLEQSLENLDRENPHPLEEALIYEQLMKPKAEGGMGMTLSEVSARCHKPERRIMQRRQLLALGEQARNALLEEKIALGHAEILSRLPDPAKQDEVLDEILGRSGDMLTVEGTRQLVMRKYMLALARAPFDIADATLAPQGPCRGCPHNTEAQPVLFADLASSGAYCQRATCWSQKAEASWQRTAEKATAEGKKVLNVEQTRAVFPYEFQDHMGSSSPYFALDDRCYALPGDATFRTALEMAKQLDGAEVTIARAPSGKIVELVDRGRVERALKVLRHQRSAQAQGGAGGPLGSRSEELDGGGGGRRQPAGNDAGRPSVLLEAKRRDRIRVRLLDAICSGIERKKDAPTDSLLRILAQGMNAIVLTPEGARDVAERRKVTLGNDMPDEAVKKLIGRLKGKASIFSLLVEILLVRSRSFPEEEQALIAELGKALRVDVKKITADVTEQVNREEKAQAKPAKGVRGAKKAAPKKETRCECCACTDAKPCDLGNGSHCVSANNDGSFCSACADILSSMVEVLEEDEEPMLSVEVLIQRAQAFFDAGTFDDERMKKVLAWGKDVGELEQRGNNIALPGNFDLGGDGFGGDVAVERAEARREKIAEQEQHPDDDAEAAAEPAEIHLDAIDFGVAEKMVMYARDYADLGDSERRAAWAEDANVPHDDAERVFKMLVESGVLSVERDEALDHTEVTVDQDVARRLRGPATPVGGFPVETAALSAPAFAEGQRVRVTRGKFTGRRGTIQSRPGGSLADSARVALDKNPGDRKQKVELFKLTELEETDLPPATAERSPGEAKTAAQKKNEKLQEIGDDRDRLACLGVSEQAETRMARDRAILARLQVATHHRVLVFGADALRLGKLIAEQGPRQTPVAVSEPGRIPNPVDLAQKGLRAFDEKQLGNEQFDRVLVVDAILGTPTLPKIKRAYASCYSGGRIVAVFPGGDVAALASGLTQLREEHNGTVEDLGEWRQLVAFWKQKVAKMGPAEDAPADHPGESSEPAEDPALTRLREKGIAGGSHARPGAPKKGAAKKTPAKKAASRKGKAK